MQGFGSQKLDSKSRFTTQRSVSYLQITLLVSLLSPLVSCQTSVIEQAVAQPHAYHPVGTSVFVEGIEAKGDRITVDLLAINGSKESIKIADNSDPVVLQDKSDKQYLSADQRVELEPYTSNSLKITFAGPLESRGEELTLRMNSNYGNEFSAPPLSIEKIPVAKGRRVEFADHKPEKFPLTNAIAHHPNGLTVTLKEISFDDKAVKVSFDAVNGSDEEIRLSDSGSDRAFLQDQHSNRYYLVPALSNQDLAIPERQKLSGTLHFAGRASLPAGQLSLHFNERYGGDQDWSTKPKIVLAGLAGPGAQMANTAEGAATSGTTLPASQNLNLQANHANGSVIRLTAVSFAEDHIALDLAITNGYKQRIRLNQHNDMILRDNLGNQYNLAPPPQNPDMEVAPGTTLRGKFSFLGRIAPSASSLTLTTNDQFGSDQDFANVPKMAIASIPVQAAQAAPVAGGNQESPTASAPSSASAKNLNLQANHANGSVMRLTAVSFAEDHIALDLAITNGYKQRIRLNQHNDMILRDNLGNQYNLAPPPQNSDMEVAPGTTLRGKFSFLGRIAPSASSLTLTTNDQFGSDQDFANVPKMAIASIPTRR